MSKRAWIVAITLLMPTTAAALTLESPWCKETLEEGERCYPMILTANDGDELLICEDGKPCYLTEAGRKEFCEPPDAE
jgi:hypothetical protein